MKIGYDEFRYQTVVIGVSPRLFISYYYCLSVADDSDRYLGITSKANGLTGRYVTVAWFILNPQRGKYERASNKFKIAKLTQQQNF
eukprot:snap_masked-scaffold_2-processed-gene-27.43-mRNA-1 protein AED:1.00 eAED:1.00 QI:0/0/0/0/1/1/2/0/85